MHQFFIEELEPRILCAADTMIPLDAISLSITTDHSEYVMTDVVSDSDLARQEAHPCEMVFVDASTPDLAILIADIRGQAHDGRALDVVVLNKSEDGVAQISKALMGRKDIAAIHLISHGGEGYLELGGTTLTATTLRQQADEIAKWGDALSPQADLVIYGCDVARGSVGHDFVDQLAKITRADVAASDNATGSDALAGDWVLEYRHGEVHAKILAPSTGTHWQGLLAAISVTTVADVVDGNISSVAALQASRGPDGFISLREAILATNNSAGSDIINLGAGTYTLSLTGTHEDAAAAGDLDIQGELIIAGVSAATSIVDGGNIDRVFDVHTPRPVVFQDISIQHGSIATSDGGGIFVQSNGNVRVDRAILSANHARDGGALAVSSGTLSVVDTTLSGNSATNNGGGVFAFKSSVEILRSTVSFNTSGSTGGGIENQGANATLTLTNVTLSGNSAASQGGALFNQRDASITNSTIAHNTSGSAGGAVAASGSGSTTLKNTLLADNVNGNAFGIITSTGHNLDTDGSAALGGTGDISGVSAQLDIVLQNNGGYTATHALLGGSLAINAGTSSGTPASDQRGFARAGATDIGAYEAAAAVVVTPPTGIALSNDTEPENLDTTGGFSIGTLTATDPDAFETFTYSIAGGADGAQFSIGGVSANELRMNAGVLDYESKRSYVVRVAVVDSTANRFEKTFTIDVSNVNEAPVNALPASATAVSGSYAVFSTGNGNALSASDPDAGSAVVRVTVSATSGALTLSGTGGLSFLSGDGIADGSMTMAGSLANINAALNGLSFLPVAGVIGAVTLTMTTEDLGNAGSGSAQVDSDSFVIMVSAAPTAQSSPISLPLNLSVSNSAANQSAPSLVLNANQSSDTQQQRKLAPRLVLAAWQQSGSRPTAVETLSPNFLDMPSIGHPSNSARGTHVQWAEPARIASANVASVDYKDAAIALPGMGVLDANQETPRMVPSVLGTQTWLEQLRQVREQLDGDVPLSNAMIGTTAFVSGGLSVGYVVWILRGGALMSTLLSSLPAWQTIDPMPILGQRQRADQHDEGDRIERMFGKFRDRSTKVGRIRVATAKSPTTLPADRA